MVGRVLEHVDEDVADAAAFFLGILDVLQLFQEAVRRVDHAQIHAEMRAEGLLHLLSLTAAQQSVVDEDACETIPDGAVHKCRRDRRVHPARQAADSTARRADQVPDPPDLVIDEMPGRPVGDATADVEQEVVQDLAAARRVRHLGVKQDAEDRLGLVLHARDGRIGAGGGDPEMRWWLVHPIAVARPHDGRRARLESGEEALVLTNRDLGAPVLPLARGHDFPT